MGGENISGDKSHAAKIAETLKLGEEEYETEHCPYVQRKKQNMWLLLEGNFGEKGFDIKRKRLSYLDRNSTSF